MTLLVVSAGGSRRVSDDHELLRPSPERYDRSVGYATETSSIDWEKSRPLLVMKRSAQADTAAAR